MITTALALLTALTVSSGPYNASAGQNAPAPVGEKRTVVHDDGTIETTTVYVPPKKDAYGNAQGNQYDLAVDGAFDGQTVAVLHFYTQENFDFHLPQAALKEKGFSVYRWINTPPSPEELREKLKKASELWIISAADRRLSDEHIKVIKEYFDAGHGVYIWGDNEPYYSDANAVGKALLGVEMHGNVPGGQNVPVQAMNGHVGVMKDHLLSTGLENVFEGITIATIDENQYLKPLIYGSAGNLVTAVYEKDGKRAIFDGGFTRLYLGWETAGTARYVKNAGAWLANYEKFGGKVTLK
jgi:hypothetical protein